MESLEQFFNDNDRGYPRDPRRMAYAKLKKNIQGMDREQLEAFIKANLFIPHSQYKMALGNLIQFLNKQDKMKQLNEVRRFQKIAGLLKENEADQVVDKVEHSVEAKLDQLSPQQIQQLQADLAKMGITADTSVEDAAKKIEGNLNEAEGDDKKKLADTLSAIGTGLIGSLLVPIIPAAIGHSTGMGMAGGLGLTLAAGGLLVGLAKALGQKQGSSEHGNNESLHPDNTATMGNINEAGAKWQSKLNPEVNGIEIYNDGDNRLFVIFDKNTGGIHVINDFNGEDFDEVWGTDGDVRPELLATIKKSGKMEDWHPDDPASVDMDDIEDQDPEDFDDES